MNRFSFRSPFPGLLFCLALLAFPLSDAVAQVNVILESGATLNGGTARIGVSGDWTADGTFAPDSSTVLFVGDAAQSVTGTDTFFGLGVDKGDASSFSLGTATTVQGELDLLSGTLDNSANDVTLSDGVTIRRATGSLDAAPTFGATVSVEYTGDTDVSTGNEVPDPESGTDVETLAVSGGGTVSLSKAVTVTKALSLKGGSLDNSVQTVTVASGAEVEPGGGTLQETPTYEGPVALTYDGTGALTTGTELPNTVDKITVQAPDGLTLAKDVVVADRLTIDEGTMDLGGSTVTLDGAATLDEQPGAVVSGASGQIQATRTLDGPSSVNVAGLGFTITSGANLGETSIVRTHARPFDGTDVAAARVYDVTPTNDGGLDATLVVRYDETELTAPNVEGPLELYKSIDDGSTWTVEGGTVDTDANTVTLSGVDALSLWTVGAEESALPVEMTAFRAAMDGGAAVLSWQTASETNNAGFEVQHRGPEGEAFSALQFVEGAGTTEEAQRYRYRAEHLDPGTHAFRLKQIDVDGVSTLTEERTVQVQTQRVVALHPNTPNPFASRTKIGFTVASDGPARVEVYNLLGQRIATLFDGPATAGKVHRLTVDSRNWASGAYFYTLRANGQRKTERMVVVR